MKDTRDGNQRRVIGAGERIFAGLMAIVWIGAGAYAVYRAIDEGTLLIAFIGFAAIVYGALWLNVMIRARHGRIPLWF
jgi:hypothetical protein